MVCTSDARGAGAAPDVSCVETHGAERAGWGARGRVHASTARTTLDRVDLRVRARVAAAAPRGTDDAAGDVRRIGARRDQTF